MAESLVRKYPRAPFELRWWYVFPASDRSVDPITGRIKRHHIDPSVLQKAMRAAVLQAGIRKRATPIPCAAVSRPISLRRATTSEPCKS